MSHQSRAQKERMEAVTVHDLNKLIHKHFPVYQSFFTMKCWCIFGFRPPSASAYSSRHISRQSSVKRVTMSSVTENDLDKLVALGEDEFEKRIATMDMTVSG